MRGSHKVRTLATVALVLLLGPAASQAQEASGGAPTLQPGAIEIGANGLMTTVEGVTHGSVFLRGAYFSDALSGLVGLEAGWGFNHIESLDETELEVAASWQRRFKQTGNYPFVSLGAGIRNEKIGSFGSVRYPLGFSVGVRSLVGQRGGFRVEYRYRRVLNDPISDFSEHHITLGLSIFFRNPGPKN